MDEFQKMQRRQARISRGAQAETAKHLLDDMFTRAKDQVVKNMVENTRESGEADTYSVFLLTAIFDIRKMVQADIDAGKRSQEAMRKDIERNAGGSEA